MIKKPLKSIWSYFNGKKTVIGIVLHTAWFVSNLAFKDLTTMDEALTGHGLIGLITGVGLGHKIVKQKINNAIDKANENK
jgi:hypothetical protein